MMSIVQLSIFFCRIFRDYGKIPGIDLAYMRNGYVYHTPYDNLDMIHPGSIQRAGFCAFVDIKVG